MYSRYYKCPSNNHLIPFQNLCSAVLSFFHIYSYLLQIKTSPPRLWQYWLQTRTSFFACSATSSWTKVGDSKVWCPTYMVFSNSIHRYIHFLVFVNKGNLLVFLLYSKHLNSKSHNALRFNSCLVSAIIISCNKCGLPGFGCAQRMNSLKQTKHKLSTWSPHCDQETTRKWSQLSL